MDHFTALVVRVFVLVVASCGAVSSATAADPVRERVEGFKASKRSIAAIEDAIGRGDKTTVAEQARLLAVFAQKIPSLHSADAKGGFFSAAKSEIWENFPDFTEKAGAFQASARNLQEAAASADADMALLSQRLRDLKNSCSSCHQSYKRGR